MPLSPCSPFVAPAVSSAAISVTRSKPGPSGSSTKLSSKSTTPGDPGRFTGAQGNTCFWPESAMAPNQVPRFSRRRNARITGFSPLLAFW